MITQVCGLYLAVVIQCHTALAVDVVQSLQKLHSPIIVTKGVFFISWKTFYFDCGLTHWSCSLVWFLSCNCSLIGCQLNSCSKRLPVKSDALCYCTFSHHAAIIKEHEEDLARSCSFHWVAIGLQCCVRTWYKWFLKAQVVCV